MSKNEYEFETECVNRIASERIQLKNLSAAYLSGYLEENRAIPIISLDTVLKAAGHIEALLEGKKQLRKELLV